jgi:hypothetical protein
MLEGILQKMDLSDGFALMLSSPGGDGLAAERIINICRSYSGIGEFWVIVPSKAKSAATIICFGASGILAGPTSELGPIDPQLRIMEGNQVKQLSVYNIVKSYEDIFSQAVNLRNGNLQPYMQQLASYDPKDISEYRMQLELSEDIAVRALNTGMMKSKTPGEIKQSIQDFLSPRKTKTHGRPIYRDDAACCDLNIIKLEASDKIWLLSRELYARTNHLVSTRVSKCFETNEVSFTAQ